MSLIGESPASPAYQYKAQNMKRMTTIGRILFAIPFAIFGINHFLMTDYYVGMLTSFIPLGAYTIILTGIMLIAASISILLSKFVKISTIMLAILLFLFIITIHIPHLMTETDKTVTLIALLKDISLMGGSLMIAGIYSEEEEQKK
jgi:uncharacterized membrane protein YphA (DoxX/SURF4 family)